MNWKLVKWKLRYALQYFPFTINTVFWGLGAWLAYHYLYNKPDNTKTEQAPQLYPFILLMAKIALWFVVFLIASSIVSAIGCWAYYLWLRKSKGTLLQIEFNSEIKTKGKRSKVKMFLNARLEGAFRPLLGFVKGRLIYDHQVMTDRFGLLGNKKVAKKLIPVGITGRSGFSLPEIKEYDLKGGFVYFQDMMHLVSLAVAQPVTGHFYQPPVVLSEEDAEVSPKKTETLDVRIEQMRRVEGEYLNYKDFEAGDDVRRIVWKVYAKNRELVVRVPEMFEPFASHLYFYASFYAPVKGQWLSEGYFKEMLNYYKNCVWTAYDALSKKEWEMRYIPDQQFNVPEEATKDERTMRTISNSTWHSDKPLSQYFSPKYGAVLCVSSLTDPKELKELLEQCDASTIVYFVRVSNIMKSLAALNILARVIIRAPEDRLSKLRVRWAISPVRFFIHRREKEIEAIMNKSPVTWGEL